MFPLHYEELSTVNKQQYVIQPTLSHNSFTFTTVRRLTGNVTSNNRNL